MIRDSLKIFRAAAWPNEQALADFASGCMDAGSAELARWLTIILDCPDDALQTQRLRVFSHVAAYTLDPALFVPYVRALRTNNLQLRGVLLQLIPKVNNVSGHIELCRTLGLPDAPLRALAGKLLGVLGGKAAYDMLVELVREPGFAGRIEAIDLMMPRALHQGTTLLIRVIEAGAPQERVHALRALAAPHFAKHPDAAIDVASRAMEDQDERVAKEALSTLASFCEESTFRDRTQHMWTSGEPRFERLIIGELARFPSPRTLSDLTRKLREGAGVVKVAVIETAEQIGTEAVLPLLVDGLTDELLPVKTAALNSLTRLSLSGAVDPARAILWLLRSRDLNTRRIAVEVVNRVGDPRGDLAPRMLKFLRDDDWWVRERTMDALVAMSGAQLSRHLVPYLSDPSPVVRRFAVNALRRIGDLQSLGPLLTVARSDDDWWVREEAVLAIGELKDPRIPQYIVKLGQEHVDLRLACVDALKPLKSADAEPFIVECLADADPDVRAAAVAAVELMGNREHRHALETLLEDPSPAVQRAARELLARWKVEMETTVRGSVDIDRLLAAVVEGDADDLLLFAGRVPYVKRRGVVEPLYGWKPFTNEGLKKLLDPLLSPLLRARFEAGADIDLSHEMRALGARFRVNLFAHHGGVGAVLRVVKNDALLIVLENLGLPQSLSNLANLKDGLVLIGGPTGAGKSTTLAAIVDRVNRTQARHIVTIEDPIETVHIGERSLVTQREVGSHTRGFHEALRAALRQDPDVIVVGEMRDAATFQFAVSAAETGHLVLGTMHTSSADQSVSRIINSFPAPQQPQVRAMLAASIRAIVCQCLLPRKAGDGRVIAAEVMLNNDAIANLIRKGKEFQIPTAIAMGRAAGMQLLDHELARLVRDGVVEAADAHARAIDKAQFTATITGQELAKTSPGRGASLVPPPPQSVVPPAPSVPPRGPALSTRPGRT